MSGISISRRTALSGLLASTSIAACGGEGKGAIAPVRVSLRQEWYPFSGYAGEVLAADQFAKAQGVSLIVKPGGAAIDPIRSVVGGNDDIGVASADLLIEAVARGADIQCIGVINDMSPTCFLVKADSEIRSPADFVGRRVGILAGTNTEKIYQLMMSRNNIDRSRIEEIEVPFEPNTFITGEYDVRPAFVYDEPVTLDRASVNYDTISPQDFGVEFIGTVYFASRSRIERDPDSLIAVLAALVRGWSEVATQEGQTRAITALKKQFPEVDEQRELESLKLGASLFLGPDGKSPLKSSREHWQNTIDGLVELGALEQGRISISDVLNETLLGKAYGKQ